MIDWLTDTLLATSLLMALVLLGFLATIVIRHPLPMTRPEMSGDLTRMLGQSVLTQYVLSFELLAVLMLAGMLGAIYFARPED